MAIGTPFLSLLKLKLGREYAVVPKECKIELVSLPKTKVSNLSYVTLRIETISAPMTEAPSRNCKILR
jgi:hypothetical protein